jgi:hypothetical protein
MNGAHRAGGAEAGPVRPWDGISPGPWHGREQRAAGGSPSPGTYGILNGVAAVSASSAWTVGDSAGAKALILRRNGKTWT